MSSREVVTQCEMVCGPAVYVAFIPDKFAVVGKQLLIDSMPGTWRVTKRYASLAISEAGDRSMDHARHREFSDV